MHASIRFLVKYPCAGATLIKGLNRGIGTVLAGSLGILVGWVAQRAGTVGEPILIAASCFILGLMMC